MSSTLSIKQFAMLSGRGRGRDSGGGRGSYDGRQSGQSGSGKGSRQGKHCGRNNHISKKYCEKFDRPAWVQLVDIDYTTDDTAPIF